MTYSKFPLLKLPLLAFRNVAEIWNPFELYNFSRISKRSKNIAKKLSKKPSAVGLSFSLGPYVSLRFPNGGLEAWGFQPDEKHALQDSYKGQRGCFQEYRFHCDDLVPTLLRLSENILYVFNCDLHHALLVESELKNDEFDSVLHWMNYTLTQQSFPFFQVYFDSEAQLYHVLEFLKSSGKQYDKVYLICSFSSRRNSEIAKRFRQQSELRSIDEIYISQSRRTNSMNVDTLTRINFRKVATYHSAWKNRDLNSFLTSWTSGNANSRMESAKLNITEVINLDVILRGLSPEFRDPRTTKRNFTQDGKTYSVYGGIDIQRNDGKVATIQWIRHAMKGEIESAPQEWIDEFEDKQLINTRPLFEEKEVLGCLWEEREFFLPRWYNRSLYIIVW